MIRMQPISLLKLFLLYTKLLMFMIFFGFQVGPPIWHGYDARQEDTTPRQKALLISAFGCGFVIGLTVYFVCFICCCLKDAFQNLDDSEDLEANVDYKAIETGNNLNDGLSGSCIFFLQIH